jgi:hypothetical protein
MKSYWNFTQAIKSIAANFDISSKVRTETWQGLPTERRPELATFEQLFVSFSVPLPSHSTPTTLAKDIRPDLPWADDHFAERISGTPHNPPPSEAWWPHAASNHPFKDPSGKFSHTYPERMWPQFAGLDEEQKAIGICNAGIRFRYGDLNDLIELLRTQPLTRQAYLPIFFPEDTGAHHGQRIPCTLGYHFIRRNDKLHVVYYIRSCDFHRHFRNDIYFTARLLLHVLAQTQWYNVSPGTFVMHITSLHLFVNDAREALQIP